MLQNFISTVLLSLTCITKSYVTDYLRLNIILDATVGLQLRALWSEVLACKANCWQKITVSPQIMFSNIWHYMQINRLSKSRLFKMFAYTCNFR